MKAETGAIPVIVGGDHQIPYGAVSGIADAIGKIYISTDVDVFDTAYAPGTGSSELTGMTPNLLFPFKRKLAATKEVVGFDVVEYSPMMDNRRLPNRAAR